MTGSTTGRPGGARVSTGHSHILKSRAMTDKVLCMYAKCGLEVLGDLKVPVMPNGWNKD